VKWESHAGLASKLSVPHRQVHSQAPQPRCIASVCLSVRAHCNALSPAGGAARKLQQGDDGDCSTKGWALDAVTDIGSELGLEPGEVQIASCVRGTSASPELGTCDEPAYILNIVIVLNPSLDAEESRCVWVWVWVRVCVYVGWVGVWVCVCVRACV